MRWLSMYNPTIFYKGKLCELQLDYYTNTGNKSIRLIDTLDGSVVAKATTNVEGVTLPANEVMIKNYMENEGQTVPRKVLLEEVWGVRQDTDTRTVDNFIARLRRYLEAEPAHPKHLQTVRGVGYRFIAEPDQSDTKPVTAD